MEQFQGYIDPVGNPTAFTVFRVLALLTVAAGSITALPIVWALADVAMGLMALVNIVAMLMLWPWARAVLADYERRVATGPTPKFVARDCLDLPVTKTKLVW